MPAWPASGARDVNRRRMLRLVSTCPAMMTLMMAAARGSPARRGALLLMMLCLDPSTGPCMGTEASACRPRMGILEWNP